jgi:hypothetical protein
MENIYSLLLPIPIIESGYLKSFFLLIPFLLVHLRPIGHPKFSPRILTLARTVLKGL